VKKPVILRAKFYQLRVVGFNMRMYQVLIVVRPFRASEVLEALQNLNVDAMIVREAKGYSRQKGYLEKYVGSEYSAAFLPKVEITVWVDDGELESICRTVEEVARTGRIGDGKIFVLEIAEDGVVLF
jgi:nitrogen regulatory protein P-II 2